MAVFGLGLTLAVFVVVASYQELQVKGEACSCNSTELSDFLFFNNNRTCVKSFNDGSRPTKLSYMSGHYTVPSDLRTYANTSWSYYNPALGGHYFVVERSVTAILVISNGIRILFDSAWGVVDPTKQVEPIKFRVYQQLEDIGCSHDMIDYVVNSHMHRDHTGWNVNWKNGNSASGKIVPTFPNAQYMIQKDEIAYWTNSTAKRTKTNFDVIFQPLLDEGVLYIQDGDYQLADHVFIEKCPGHTPGHECGVIKDADMNDIVYLTGDVIHHPVQVQMPDWSRASDYNATFAASTRKSYIRRAVENDAIVIPQHSADPFYGKIVNCSYCGGTSGYAFTWI